MTVQPFTPSGVAAKQAELNALSDSELNGQADLIQSDLKSWVNDNFTLTTDQSTYLSGIDTRWIKFSGDIISIAVRNRLNVILTTSGDPSSLKLIHTTNDIIATSDGTGFSISGSVRLQVVYS